MGRWQQGQPPIATRLARIALRAQRLLMLRRLDQVRVLVRSHTPDLCQVPGGTEALTKIEAQLQEARRRIEETSLG